MRRVPPKTTVAVVVTATALVALALAASAISATSATSATAWRTVRYAGLRLEIPAGWPVYDLARDPGACVRFDRHALYLGSPDVRERCPARAAGRTEAILVERASGRAAARAAGLSGEAAGRLVLVHHRVAVILTWSRHPGLVRRALGLAALPALPHPTRPHAHQPRASAAAARRASPAAPGAIYTGPGFDACSAPGPSQMSAWQSSRYRAIGVYIGGANMACAQPNLTPSWVTQEATAGWHLIPIYVGLQAPQNSCGCAPISPSSASAQGSAAADDAVSQARALGLGAGNPLYFDMEGYAHTASNTSAVLAFLAAWTNRLHAAGFLSGVYSSENSGIVDLVSKYGTAYAEPDELWIANWNGSQTTSDAAVPSGDWSHHQRLHQYQGAHDETHGGVTINIDGDYLDSATAGPPPASSVPPAPAASVAPADDGSIRVYPTWPGNTEVASWQLLAGASPMTLTATGTPIAAGTRAAFVVHSAFAYFAVSALDASGHVLASSDPVATPPHVSLPAASAFAPARGLTGVPVGCLEPSSCHVTLTVSSGATALASTGREFVPVGGGVAYFRLPAAARRALRRGGSLVKVTARESSGASATRVMRLVPFATAGAVTRRSIAQSPSVHILSSSGFVSRGWVGGILAGCLADVPCHVAASVSAGQSVIARTGSEFLGAHELGYVIFTLTPQGHALLRRASGNQLPVQVTISSAADTVTAGMALVSFG